MVLASHYILRDILHLLEGGRKERLEEVCSLYRDRYTEDEELLDIFDSLLTHIRSGADLDLPALKNRLSELIESRRMEVSGGIRPP